MDWIYYLLSDSFPVVQPCITIVFRLDRGSSRDPDSISMCSDFVLDDPVTCIENERRYMVVDCGGGTVDITVHEMSKEGGKLKELFKATGGPFGSTTVDEAFKVSKTDNEIPIMIISFLLRKNKWSILHKICFIF